MNKENKNIVLHVRITKTQLNNFKNKLNGKCMSEIIRNYVINYDPTKENV